MSPNPTKYRVSADIRFVSGALAGLVLDDGYYVTTPDESVALRIAGWINRSHEFNETVQSCAGNYGYQFVSNAVFKLI